MFDKFDYFNKGFIFGTPTNKYNPYINYSWSQTITVRGNQQIKDTGTAGLNLQQFFGQGCWFNGIDQNIVLETVAPAVTSSIWTICFNVNTASNKYIVRTIGGSLKVLWFKDGLIYYNGSANIKLDTTNLNRAGGYIITSDGNNIYTYLNGVLISTISQTVEQLSFGAIKDLAGNSSANAYLGILKDVYLFKKALTKTEIEKYNNNPNQFFMDSLEDSACILAMPMCEKNNIVRNYKNNTDYPITNYLATCRTNAQRLPYGLQTSVFKRDSLGRILSKSNFLEADGVGYGNTGWVPKWNEDFTVETVLEISNDSEFRINGNNYDDGIYFGKNSIGKNLYVRVFGSTVMQIANTKNIVCLTFSYNWQSKEVKCYVDGVLKNTQLATLTTNSTLPVLLGMIALSGDNYPVIKPIRLFKVHSKVLTQEEITKNFNKYQSQGLLNE